MPNRTPPVRLLRGSGALVAAVLAGGVLAAPAEADLGDLLTRGSVYRGWVTVTETRDNDAGDTYSRRTVTWNLNGRSRGPVGARMLRAVPRVDEFFQLYRTESDCIQEQFIGWVGSPWGDVNLDFRAINAKTGRATGTVFFASGGSEGRVSSTRCDGSASWVDEVPLIADPVDTPNPPAIIGVGSMNHSIPSVHLSPQVVTFRKAGRNRWVSSGAVTRTETRPEDRRVVLVTWDLVSPLPSPDCLLPRQRSVRGESVRSTRRQVKKAGFKPARRTDSTPSTIRRGKTAGIWSEYSIDQKTARCGTTVRIQVSV